MNRMLNLDWKQYCEGQKHQKMFIISFHLNYSSFIFIEIINNLFLFKLILISIYLSMETGGDLNDRERQTDSKPVDK